MLPTIDGVFRLVDDPELRFTPSGKAVSSMRIVADKKKKEGDEWVDDKVCWLNASAWERMAENIAESFQKGDLVIIKGALETRSYENREGEKRQSYDVNIYEIGPSVRFNPAKVERTQRQRADSGASQPSGEGQSQPAAASPAADPWATPPGGSEEPPF